MAIDRRVVEKIWQILPPHGSRGLTPAQVYDALGNLRGKTTQPEVSRYLSSHAHRREGYNGKPILGARRGHLFTKPPAKVSQAQVERESLYKMKTAEPWEN